MRKMILSLSLIGLLSVTAQANFELGGIKFDKIPLQVKSLSVSNGGTIEDSEALKDGVGVKIIAFETENMPNFKKMNRALLGSKEGETLKEALPELFAKKNNAKREDISIKCYGAEIGIEIDGYLVVDNSTIGKNLSRADTLCTSNVTDMSRLFRGKDYFNKDISKWDTSNVTDMSYMFWKDTNFNQPIGSWDVSKVKNMYGMFYKDNRFNQPLNNWNVSSVLNMRALFDDTTDFNQPLDKWDTSNVVTMKYMFYKAKSFNQDLSMWNTAKILDSDDFDFFADKWEDKNKIQF